MGAGASKAKAKAAAAAAEQEVLVAENYSDRKYLLQTIKQKKVQLVSPQLFIDYHKAGKPLPKCQDVPSKYVLDPDALTEEQWEVLEVIAISYCWISPDHPDPNGYYLRGRRRRGLCTERAPLPPTLPQFSLQPPQLLAAARPAVHTFTSFPTPSFLACAFIIYTCLLRLVPPLLIPSYACLARPRICLPRNDWNILNQSGGRGEPGRGRVPRP